MSERTGEARARGGPGGAPGGPGGAGARKQLLVGGIGAAVIALDQLTKAWARGALRPLLPRARVIVEGYFDLRYSENSGSAFGLFRDLPGGRWLLTLVAVAALAAIAVFVRRAEPGQRRLLWALGFVAGGAVGNVVDRVLYGRVTDFVVWKIGRHEWPAFNVADAALCVGVGLMLLDSLRGDRTRGGDRG